MWERWLRPKHTACRERALPCPESMAGLRVMIKLWGLTMWPVNIIRMISVTLFDKLAGRVPSPSDLGGKIDL